MALQTVNKCLSDAVCALAQNMLDGESRAVALIQSGNEIVETARYSSEARLITSYLLLLHHVTAGYLCLQYLINHVETHLQCSRQGSHF